MEINSSLTLQSIAQKINAQLIGDPNFKISNVATLHNATHNTLTFYHNERYKDALQNTGAGAIIIAPKDQELTRQQNILLHPNPHVAFAQVMELFYQDDCFDPYIEDSVVIGDNCQISDKVAIGHNVVIGDNVTLEDGVIIKANTVIGDNVTILSNTKVFANVSIYPKVVIGNNCIIQSGVVLGADGFGFARDNDKWHKILHRGKVIVGDDVEIGANSTVDRGTLDDTVIGNGVKIDNQVQIAHNVVIGDNTIVAGCSGIAGSVQIGKNCILGGGCRIRDHVTVAENVVITGGSMVYKSILESGQYSSGLPVMPSREWFRTAVRIADLNNMARSLQRCKRMLDALHKSQVANSELTNSELLEENYE